MGPPSTHIYYQLTCLISVRGRSPNAFETYKSLPAHYAPHGWTSLESFMRMQALTVHDLAVRAKDEEWLHIALAFLKTYVEDMGKELLMDVDDHVAYVTDLVAAVRDAARGLQSGICKCWMLSERPTTESHYFAHVPSQICFILITLHYLYVLQKIASA